MEMNRPSNQKIIETYLNHYRHSKQSVKTRKSCLNYFFESKYFGYGDFYIPSDFSLNVVFLKKHIFDIDTDTLIDYFDYLKHLKTIGLVTKKTKWILLIKMLKFSMEYYRKHNFVIVIPKDSINWNGITHKRPNTNKDIIMTKEEVKQILEYCKLTNYHHYLIFRIFAETGVRKTGLINIDYDKINIEKRYFETIEKYGREVIYYYSKDLAKHLPIYLKQRKLRNSNSKAFFLSNHLKRFSERPFNIILKTITKELGIDKNITCHTFRRTLNTLRFNMGCPDRVLKILLNHKVENVNYNSYVKLNYNQYLEMYDLWYPFQDIQI